MKNLPIISAALLSLTLAASVIAPVRAGEGVNVGYLDCKVGGSVGFIVGSTKSMNCVFKRADGSTETYRGEFDRYGLDIGFIKEARMIWGVFAPGVVERGALAGTYAGAGADVAAGLGLGANALFGGGNDQVALQPVSVNGNVGVNVAAGVAYVKLTAGK